MDQLDFPSDRRSKIKSEIIDLIETLHHRERLVISMYYYDQLSFKEIGIVLRLAESQVWTIYADAVGILLKLKLAQ